MRAEADANHLIHTYDIILKVHHDTKKHITIVVYVYYSSIQIHFLFVAVFAHRTQQVLAAVYSYASLCNELSAAEMKLSFTVQSSPSSRLEFLT